MKVITLDASFEKKYEEYLLTSDRTLFYASNKYRLFLKALLKKKDSYFLLIDNNKEIKAALPAFISENSKYGNIINSLPFFGSIGGIIDQNTNLDYRKKILKSFDEFSVQNNCAASTIITSPFELHNEFYDMSLPYTYKDYRIGQITPLPEISNDIEDKIFCIYESAGRRNIKKAIKNDINVITEFSDELYSFLINTHTENIRSINGITKTAEFFYLIPDFFEYNRDFKLYTALLKNKPIASLLLFYFNKTVEYFVPAIHPDFRTLQPLSLIIYRAMIDAVKKNFLWWNWGGTWESQESLYNFKKKWGTRDFPYYYYTKIYNNNILKLSKEEIQTQYKNFFIFPFNKVQE